MESSEDNLLDKEIVAGSEHSNFHPLAVLGLLLGGIILFTLLGSVLIFGVGMMYGYDLGEITGIASGLRTDTDRGFLKLMVSINQLFTFLIPGLVTAYVVYKKNLFESLSIKKSPLLKNVLLAVVIIFCSYPLVQLTYWLNQQIPLPEIFMQMEDTTKQLLETMLAFDSPLELMINIIVVALIPALGEEIVFRGLIQKNFEWLLNNGHAAVWVSAFIFSAIHMQFQGFIPRMILGAVLGYLFYFSKNLWLPIIAHFFNNAATLMVQSFYGEEMNSYDMESTDMAPWWVTILVSVLMIYLFYILAASNNSSTQRKLNT